MIDEIKMVVHFDDDIKGLPAFLKEKDKAFARSKEKNANLSSLLRELQELNRLNEDKLKTQLISFD